MYQYGTRLRKNIILTTQQSNAMRLPVQCDKLAFGAVAVPVVLEAVEVCCFGEQFACRECEQCG